MRITAIIFMLGVVASCQTAPKINSGQHYVVSEADLAIIPYQGKKALVFVSSEKDTLRLFSEGVVKDSIGSDPWAKNPDYFDRYIYTLAPRKNDTVFTGEIAIKLLAEREKALTIEFYIAAKGLVFYGTDYFSREQLAAVPVTEFTLGTTTYTDVQLFKSTGRFSERDNSIETVYFSKSAGFLGFDKKTTQWRLLLDE